MLSLLGKSCGVIGTMGFGLLKNTEPKPNDIVEVNKIKFTSTGMTTADAIQMQEISSQLLSQGAEVVAMEVSSHGLVQHRVEALDINTAIFTNLSHDHLDYHKTMAAYGQAKLKLFTMPSIQSVVINSDDLFAEKILNALSKDVRAVTYGMHLESNYENYFAFTDVCPDKQGMKATLHSPEGEFLVQTQLIGHFNLHNLLAVIAVLWVNGYDLESVIKHIPFLKPVAGRMELLPTVLKFQVVVDYAHTPDALKQSLLALKPFVTGRLWCVFGCGGDRDKEKRPEMAKVAEALADNIIVTNDNPRNEVPENIFSDIRRGFSRAHQEIPDRADAIAFAIQQAAEGDVILIAGKGHEDYQLIGGERFSFSDQKQARLVLREKEGAVASD
jgi:UDP-N-acetylmuramoyl-L-alanyl-D-glutamate--2,6-diaminopimelate ligase